MRLLEYRRNAFIELVICRPRITISEVEGKDGWGESVVKQLGKDLKIEFEGERGFSVQNLWYMRKFYLTYKDNPKLQPLVGEISWSHHTSPRVLLLIWGVLVADKK